MRTRREKVLIVTGSLLSAHEPSALAALERQLSALRASSGVWLDLRIKLLAAEQLAAAALLRRSRGFAAKPYRAAVERFFDAAALEDPPELTEVSLATLLEAEGLEWDTTTYAAILGDREAQQKLEESTCVFASTTLIRDRSELVPLMARLQRPHNRVIAGGALASILHATWEGCEGVDLLAVGYGELLVPAIASWIRSGYRTLTPPPFGRIEQRAGATMIFSGVPPLKDLDALPSPDWTLAARHHQRRFDLVHYESVRGCPYRCAFCNYPYLFDDTKFRHRSAEKIDRDWAELEAQGAKVVSCLDSLFTMPRRRLVDLCERLIARGSRLKWICYARADDLAEPDTVALMKAAGCQQVQIGLESGSQAQLDRMNKRCTVEKNRQALKNCREAGLTSLVTVIVGFPGETRDTLKETVALLRDAPPDVYYAAPFNTRVEYVPILSAESRKKYGIVTAGGGASSAPYWRHDSMSCTEIGQHLTWIHRELMRDRVALEGTMFYAGLLGYDAKDRDALLDFQRDVAERSGLLQSAFGALHRFAQRRLERDAARTLVT